MLAPRRLTIAVLATGLFALRAVAASAPLAAPKQTTAVAAFPDAVPTASSATPAPKPPETGPRRDPTEDLLQRSPYPTPSRPVERGRDVSIANPYVDELRLVHSEATSPESPYAGLLRPEPAATARGPAEPALKDPYSPAGGAPTSTVAPSPDPAGGASARQDLKNPYAASEDAPQAPRPSSQLVLDLRQDFQGVILVDGLAVPRGAPFPVLPGRHTVSVFPKDAPPYQLLLYVRPDRTEQLTIR